ncbi:TPA: PP2C family serine/threonine-protein phosphatase [Yersinia enterocolitica]|nr:serine/threonine protein phosphatase [Yersinia enterocolitica]HDL6653678.1 serine/threonine protein phosphatase [Yersinia enterocolitica]HDL8439146.1 serine/threonine protein phosphatase [Yersinia enterocolitica]HEF9708168.1 serine/threonine protein phosphatase [Yersinia enterocolitica]
MVESYFFLTATNGRKDNHDKFFFKSFDGYSVSIMLDGFSALETNPHYVDTFIDFLYLNLNEFVVFDDACHLIETVINDSFGADGKACIAAIVSSEDRFRYLTIGDCRIYFLSDKERTKDDSVAQKLVDAKVSSPKSIAVHPYRNKLTKFISRDCKHDCDLFHDRKNISNDGFVLMCTDGFWSNADEQHIWSVDSDISMGNIFTDICESSNKSTDNISVALLKLSSSNK